MTKYYFLGGVTPNGFSTSLSELIASEEYFTYILKGGPGTGKSSVMKKIANVFEGKEDVTRYYCSSDPDSLDAVLLHSSKVIIVDGTPPHVFEPLFPGVCQKIINLGECWDDSLLKEHREDIIRAVRQNKALMKSASENHKILGSVCTERKDKSKEFVNIGRISDFAADFCRQYLKVRNECSGKEFIRQLSVMTRYGYMTHMKTIDNYQTVFFIKDDLFAATDVLLKLIAREASERGYDVRLSNCLLFGTAVREHLLIDGASLALVSSNPLTQITCTGQTLIDCSDFYDRDFVQSNKEFFSENENRIRELSDRSAKLLEDAKKSHDEIERYYIRAMDFAAIDRIYDSLYNELTQ